MEQIYAERILRGLLERTRAQRNGALLFFNKAGVTLQNENEISLDDIKNLQETNPNVFEEMIRFLFPEIKAYANADGETTTEEKKSNFDYYSFFGSLLSGVGSGLAAQTNSSDSAQQLENAKLSAETELAKSEAEQKEKTMYIVLGMALVVIVAVIIIVIKLKK